MKPLYDPKLRDAAEEFKAICKKYDCIGVVLFVSPTNSEFVNNIHASWSAMSIEPDNHSVRIRCKREDFASHEDQKKVVDATSHALTSIYEWTRLANQDFFKVICLVREKWKFLWKAWDCVPDSIPGDGK